MTQTYYDYLEISPSCSPDEIKKAYRRLSFVYHPDKSNDKEEEFKRINEAYQVLGDPEKRKEYDMSLKLSKGVYGGMCNFNEEGANEIMDKLFNTLFESVINNSPGQTKQKVTQNMEDLLGLFTTLPFGGSGFSGGIGVLNGIPSYGNPQSFTFPQNMNGISQPNIPTSPTNDFKSATNDDDSYSFIFEDLYTSIDIDMVESYFGTNKPYIVKRNVYHGEQVVRQETERIYVEIPKGIDQDEIVEIQQKGHIYLHHNKTDTNKSGKISNLKIKINIVNDAFPDFRRSGLNIFLKHNISFKESLCGFSFILSHINGKQTKISSSRGSVIQNGDKKIIKGLGFQRNDNIGNLIIEIVVSPPSQKLTEDQLKLIEEVF